MIHKVGRVYRRLGTPAKKVQQIGKSPFLFFGFSICKICWKSQIWSWFVDLEPLEDVGSIWSEQFCIFSRQQASPLAALACLGLPEFSCIFPGDPGRPVQLVGLPADVKKYKITNFKCFLHPPGALNPQTKIIFVIFSKFCIWRSQKTKMDFFRFAALFLRECPTSYTLYQPWCSGGSCGCGALKKSDGFCH